MKKIVALAAIGAFCVSGQALAKDVSAAQMSAVKGTVMVQQNGKMVSADKASALRAGDRVVASAGSAKITFADGCAVSLKAGSAVTVGAASPCAAGAGIVSANSAQTSQMFGDLTALQVAGYVAVAVGLGIGIANVVDDDPDSVSP